MSAALFDLDNDGTLEILISRANIKKITRVTVAEPGRKTTKTFVLQKRKSWRPANDIPPLTVEEWDDGETHYKVEKSEPLILLTDDGKMRTGRLIRENLGDFWIDDGGATYQYNVTHWMPQPTPPHEE